MGVSQNRVTPSHHPLEWRFPWTKPSSYEASPMTSWKRKSYVNPTTDQSGFGCGHRYFFLSTKGALGRGSRSGYRAWRFFGGIYGTCRCKWIEIWLVALWVRIFYGNTKWWFQWILRQSQSLFWYGHGDKKMIDEDCCTKISSHYRQCCHGMPLVADPHVDAKPAIDVP